ncbi:acyl-CoA dehydrogenase [Chromobacterium amazonense]|nr:acyl-CoA dehydrogenase [Chromobacterium amazonense]
MADVIEPQAAGVDAEARFPRAGIEALGQAGVLGWISAIEVGGAGEGLRAAALAVEKVAEACPSTAMVLTMHFCGALVLEAYGAEAVRRDIAAGRHLTTLAWSEAGSRRHFWASLSTARQDGDEVVLDGDKSWITSAQEANSYVWSSRPLAAEGASSMWWVPSATPGLHRVKPFDGMGLRGNASAPVQARQARVPLANLLGEDGGGFDIMVGKVLPVFAVLNASCSIGMMDAMLQRASQHVGLTRFHHLDSSLADLPTIRAYLARARVAAASARALRDDTLSALEAGRSDAMLKVLMVKACAGENALTVADISMRVCGGAAFRKEVGVERFFRAASVMGPTTDVLYDFIGKVECGLPLFG